MYSSLIVLLFVLGTIQNFLIAGFVTVLIGGSVWLIVRWYNEYQDVEYGHGEGTGDQVHRKWLKRLIGLIAVLSIFGAILGSIPDKGQILAYAALKSVDQYNKDHPNTTMLTPDKLTGVGSDVVSVIDEALQKAKNLLADNKGK